MALKPELNPTEIKELWNFYMQGNSFMEIADKLTDLRRKAGGGRCRHGVLRNEVSKVVRAAGLPTNNYANYLGEFGEKLVDSSC